MKLLWVSNHPRSPSGYGSQTRQVGSRLIGAGVDIEFTANDGVRGTTEWNGAVVRGSGQDRYSRDKAAEDFARSGATHAIVLYDPWVYTQGAGDPFDGLPAIAWAPVDHFPTPPSMVPWLSKHAAIAMSQYGYDRLRETSAAVAEHNGGRGFPVFYAPHAIEPVFRPLPPEKQRLLGIPADAFVVGVVAANTGTMAYDRKGFDEMAQALSGFIARHDDVYVYLHTLDHGPQGIRITDLLRAVVIPPDRVRFVDQYRYKEQEIDDDEMAAIYSSFDVLLATSHGEGFGLPVLEAQACGAPAIVSNWTAQPELVGEVWSMERPGAQKTPSGWIVPVQPDWDPAHAAWFATPLVPHIVGALEDAYSERANTERREAAVAKAANWGADKVFAEHWVPILRDIEKLRVARVEQPNRAQRRAAKRKAGRVA